MSDKELREYGRASAYYGRSEEQPQRAESSVSSFNWMRRGRIAEDSSEVGCERGRAGQIGSVQGSVLQVMN